ncbi:MAG TPA: cobalamin-binding protein [Hyphomicrobiaceae bacterium]|nr:cobalamin-binding protein [Hyphomicrobiaceae bacterium]
MPTDAQRGKRVVSLIASATEIVAALGRQDWLVGRSHECDFPPEIVALPALTEAKLDPTGSSAEINERVLALVRDGLSVYRVDTDRLRDLAPDVIITQDHCEVCAVSLKDVEEATRCLAGRHVEVVSLRPHGLEDVFRDIERVAVSLDADAQGRALLSRLRKRLQNIAATAGSLPRRSVAFIEWIDPLMSGGNWMPSLIETAGGRDLLGLADAHSPFIAWESLAEADPDVIVIAPCGFDITRTLAEMPVLEKSAHWRRLRAVRDGRVYIGDGNAYFNRPGPRLVETAEILAEVLHPEAFRFGHEGRGWIRIVTTFSPSRGAEQEG